MDIARIRKKLKEAGKKNKTKAKSVAKVAGKAEQVSGNSQTDDRSITEIQEHVQDVAIVPSEGTSLTNEIDTVPGTGTDDLQQEEQDEFLVFRMGREDFAIRVEAIEEIMKPRKITPVPRVDGYVLGIASYRGKILPVVDVRKRLTGVVDRTGIGRAKVLILKGPKGSIGVPVEGSMDVMMISKGNIMGPPSHMSPEESKYVEGVYAVGGGFVSVIRTDELLEFKTTLEG